MMSKIYRSVQSSNFDTCLNAIFARVSYDDMEWLIRLAPEINHESATFFYIQETIVRMVNKGVIA